MTWTGGCLCGAVRYSVEGDPLWMCHCHCSMCRRLTGAGFGSWVGFPAKAFTWIKGQPSFYRSSPQAEVGFCGNCGGTLSFHRLKETSASLGSLDHPENVPAGPNDLHVFTRDKIPWLKIEDDLPRYEQLIPGREEEVDSWQNLGDDPVHRDQR